MRLVSGEHLQILQTEHRLRARLLLLLPVKSEQRDAGHLDDLESHTGDVTNSMALPAESRNQHLILQGERGEQ